MGIFSDFFKPNIGKLKEEKSVDGLARALQYKDPVIRMAAAEALGEIGGIMAIEPLTRALGDDHDLVRLKAAEALSRIGWRREEPRSAVVDQVDEVAEPGPQDDASSQNISSESVGAEPFPDVDAPQIASVERSYDDLVAETMSPDPLVRQGAVEALGECRDAKAIEPVLQMLPDSDTVIREKAASALDRLGWQPEESPDHGGSIER
ncbi:MAG: HEAT repeat domain-containing protein, partial [Methanobacteriota archaeon]